MRFKKFSLSQWFIILACLLLNACGGSSSDTVEEVVQQKSFITLKITDAPIDTATEVVVEFTGVELKPASGAPLNFDFDEAKTIDLLALQGNDSEVLLENIEVESGSYQWARLKVNAQINTMDSYISFENGNSFSLYVPSGNQSGLKLNDSFTVLAGQTTSFTIDFDLRKSVINPKGLVNDYILKPRLRIIDNAEISTITGTVSDELMNQASCAEGASIYVFSGHDMTPDDEGSSTPPLTSSFVNLNSESGIYEFVVAYLSPGNYTLSLTCDADLDAPEVDDDITFLASVNVSTDANQTAEVMIN
ncbi:DUF4382 domain-containing protein [Aliikangiella coralliicola]|nr:DUF4382 domain-containing protein [Aliikangiella coralliicola]